MMTRTVAKPCDEVTHLVSNNQGKTAMFSQCYIFHTSCEFSAESVAMTTNKYSDTTSLSSAPDTTITPTLGEKRYILDSLSPLQG